MVFVQRFVQHRYARSTGGILTALRTEPITPRRSLIIFRETVPNCSEFAFEDRLYRMLIIATFHGFRGGFVFKRWVVSHSSHPADAVAPT